MGSDEVISHIKMRCLRCNEEFSDGTQICPHDGNRLIVALPDPLIGKTFAERYEILSVIGRGGMSVVYKAQQKFMQNFVAIKVLNQNLVLDPGSFERFKQEAVAAISIHHKNVIQVLDFGISDEKAFLIMEYLEGQDLGDWLHTNGEMPVERALKVFIQACDGLAHAHAKGIIHRDLKPGNLFLMNTMDGSELVKIVDFGIAKVQTSDAVPQNLTQPGEVFGSPLYMSPEQCQGKSLDARSDIYSLGCVLYEALTGVPPLMGINSFETMNKHVGEKPLSVRGMDPGKDIPAAIDDCILKALSKNPDDRQQSMNEFKKELIKSARGTQMHLGQRETDEYKTVSDEDARRFAAASGGNRSSDRASDATTSGASKNVSDAKGSEESSPASISGRFATSDIASHLQDSNVHPEVQKIVNETVDLKEKHEEHNKQLRKIVTVLISLLVGIVCGGIMFATMPGPSSDPAPFYQREPYLWKIAEGEAAIREGKYKKGISAYEAAVKMSKAFGDGNEKKTKALYGLLVCLQRGEANPELVASTRRSLLDANLKHMEYIYGHDGHDLMNIIDLDAGLLSRVGGDKVDKAFAEQLAKKYIANAHMEFDKKNYVKAMSWLEEALEIEEQTHRSVEVSKTAAKFAGSEIANEHIKEIEEILQRAREAEHEVEEKAHH